MQEWEERKIKEIENNIDNTITGLNIARCMAVDVSQRIALHDGKCWNNRIRKDINDFLASTYEGRCIVAGYDYDCTFRIELQGVPYIVPSLYVGRDKHLYTKAHNYRIDVKDIQAQAETFIAKCDKLAGELKRDKENLLSVISQYHILLAKAEQIANTVTPFTRETIRDSKLFSRPVYSFF